MSTEKCETAVAKRHDPAAARRYVAIPHVALEVPLQPVDLAVFVSLLSYLPYSWDTLLAGRRLTCARRADEIAARAGIGVRTLAGAMRRLVALGLVRMETRGRLPSRWEVLPRAFGLASDDVERRRSSELIGRHYVALPLSVTGTLSPAELAVLVDVLAACGSRPYSRAQAGERLVATLEDSRICERSGVSSRTVRRAISSLAARGMLSGDLRRGRWILEVSPSLYGAEAPADLPNNSANLDKSAEQAVTHHHEPEELGDRRGARARAAVLYPGLLALVYGGAPTIATASMRGRVARSALQLALAGAVPAEVDCEGWRLAREKASPPRPEAVVDAVLAMHARARLREADEARFAARPPAAGPVAAPRPAPPPIDEVLLAALAPMELSALKWRSELAAGDPAAESFRELLGGLLPWEAGYVPLVRRAGSGAAPC